MRFPFRSGKYVAASVALALVLVPLLSIAFLGGATGDDIAIKAIERNGKSSTLVVLLHAWNGDAERMSEVKAVVRRDLPDADLFVPQYVANLFSNNDPMELSSKLDRRLEQIYQDKLRTGAGYRSIVLVGHSAGALLLRRAYLYGRGYRSDHANPELRHLGPIGGVTVSTWTDAVDRLTLLAAMNRGWDLQKIDNRTWSTQIAMLTGVVLNRLTGTGKLIMALERGAPFVGNLRIDWVRMVRSDPARVAPVVQLLGEKDDLVTPGDDVDAVTAPNFIFVRLDDTDHNNIRRMGSETQAGVARATHFSKSMIATVAELQSTYVTNRLRPDIDDSVRHVVFIKHGIRDMADWSNPLKHELEKTSQDISVRVEKFPYFSMMSFLLWWDRQSEVRRFVDEYATALARFRRAEKLSYVGHSFGTYIVASALERYPSISFDRIYFAGSTVRRDYDWGRLAERFQAVRNDRADNDWVVAIFPRAFEQLRGLIGASDRGILDVGSAGFNGFIQQRAADFDFHYLRGDHGAALEFETHREQAKSIASFITAEDPKLALSPSNLVGVPSGWATILGQMALLVVTGLLGAAIGAGILLDRWLNVLAVPRTARVLGILTYVGLIAIVLNTF